MSCIHCKFNCLPRLGSFLFMDLFTGVKFAILFTVPLWLIYSFESASGLDGSDLGKFSFLDNISDLLINPSRWSWSILYGGHRCSSHNCRQDSPLLCHQQQERVAHRLVLLSQADHRSLPHCRRNRFDHLLLAHVSQMSCPLSMDLQPLVFTSGEWELFPSFWLCLSSTSSWAWSPSTPRWWRPKLLMIPRTSPTVQWGSRSSIPTSSSSNKWKSILSVNCHFSALCFLESVENVK